MAQRIHKIKPSLTNELNGFNRIDLKEINKAKLMNRLDNKFIVSFPQLIRLLEPLSDKFYILDINNTVNHSYTSHYFDTFYYDMYMSHHNKRVNRHKVRQRMYNTSGDSYLEVKFKNNKGVTKKTRIATTGEFKNIPYQHFDFIKQHTGYPSMALQRVLENNFNRITLTNKDRNQRITIDTDLNFWANNKFLDMPNLAIIEVKSVRNNIDKTIFDLFKQSHIQPTGMSKYSIGLAMLKPDLKQNLFKQKINSINKLCHAC